MAPEIRVFGLICVVRFLPHPYQIVIREAVAISSFVFLNRGRKSALVLGCVDGSVNQHTCFEGQVETHLLRIVSCSQ